ncbi:MAG: hypothetical protein OQJ81_01170, partial [Melioribacteraceae bacterium]|nr:hypothetical protein [Melioribacteraceae bacterium]
QSYNQNQKKLVDELVQLSINGLNDMFIESELEFAMKKKLHGEDLILEGRNIRYTFINLIGLYKAECNGFKINIDLKKILINKIENANNLDGVGDIGLLLWATSLISHEDLPKILTQINFQNILTSYKDAESKLTMELSWLLIGLLMASTFSVTFKQSVGDLIDKIYQILRNNYGGKGIFKHLSTDSTHGKIRGNIASFADQVYPIYAFVLYSQQTGFEESLLIAEETAQKICQYQGENGEWMWHYNAKTGEVVSKYPVYSVHQDAMAPMALFAIQKATKNNYEKYIVKGLDWLINNPLNYNMISSENNAIWRAIEPDNTHRKIRSTLSNLGLNLNNEYKNLKVLKECWSYHLGWLLYAFAGRTTISDIDQCQKKADPSILYFNKA